jgi:hypothetical protein
MIGESFSPFTKFLAHVRGRFVAVLILPPSWRRVARNVCLAALSMVAVQFHPMASGVHKKERDHVEKKH